METLRQNLFKDLKCVVVKIGTNIILNQQGGIDTRRVGTLVNHICRLQNSGHSMVLVSSGAIGVGMDLLGLKKRPKDLSLKRACASMGQIHLMKFYSQKFERRGQRVAQILLSDDDFFHRERFSNIRDTVATLLARGIIPIINENDTISSEAMTVGDNDKLASDVAHFLEADLLVILSDQQGLYTQNPNIHKGARHIAIVPRVTKEIESLGSGTLSQNSVGGMRAKLRAIKQATEAGTPVVLAHGQKIDLFKLVSGKKMGTLFLPNAHKLKREKRWLAYVSKTKGVLHLDEGATRVLMAGKSSLLAVGIASVTGTFKAQDFVTLSSKGGQVIGRGKISYSSKDLQQIIGKKSSQFLEILGRKTPEEVIHRNNLIIFTDPE